MRSMTGRLAVAGAVMAAIVALAIVLLWPRHESVSEFRVGDIAVSGPWARATPGASRVGAAYLTIVNRGVAPDRLVRAETAAAERIELHNTMTENGVMRMRPLESVALAPGQTVHFAPGGMHLMLTNLAAPLEVDKEFTMRLMFERAGVLEVPVRIAGVGAGGPAEAGQDGGHGGH